MAHGSPDLQETSLKSLSWRQQETNENKNVELLGRFRPCPYVWRKFPEELLVMQVETIVKNEQFADVEAVNFVKVVVNKEFDGNILSPQAFKKTHSSSQRENFSVSPLS